jgi:hypothetical protein
VRAYIGLQLDLCKNFKKLLGVGLLKIILATVALFFCFNASAAEDYRKLADLDLICLMGSEVYLSVKSSTEGSVLTLDSKQYPMKEQLLGVTWYDFQFVQIKNEEEGFNITIAGKDIRTAFKEEIEFEAEEVVATVRLFESQTAYDLDCKGKVGFSKLPN